MGGGAQLVTRLGFTGTLPASLFVAHPLPIQAHTREAVFFLELQLPTQPVRVSAPPRPPEHRSQQGPLTGWVVDMQQTKGGEQSVKGVPQQDQAQGQGLGSSDLLPEVGLSPITLPHHSEPPMSREQGKGSLSQLRRCVAWAAAQAHAVTAVAWPFLTILTEEAHICISHRASQTTELEGPANLGAASMRSDRAAVSAFNTERSSLGRPPGKQRREAGENGKFSPEKKQLRGVGGAR